MMAPAQSATLRAPSRAEDSVSDLKAASFCRLLNFICVKEAMADLWDGINASGDLVAELPVVEVEGVPAKEDGVQYDAT